MFDITVIPYLVFVIMAIPPFIFGYFKGWRSGFFTLLLTIATGGILIGISFAIYNGTLWPLFRNIFIGKNNPENLNIESLKEISKSSVISIFVGIALVPGILLIWGIYLVSKKLLNKYMQPNLKIISSNEIRINRKNLKLTKTGGILLNGVAGLIVAATITSSVATLTVSSKNSNIFTKVTGGISNGMTFGFAQYDEDYQKMFEFVKVGKEYEDQIQLFDNLFEQKNNPNGSFEMMFENSYEKFMSSTKEHQKFIESTNMAKNSEEISMALMTMLLGNSISSQFIDIISPVTASNSIEKNSLIDDEKGKSIDGLESFVKSHTIGLGWNEAGVREALQQYFDYKIIGYEKSSFYEKWLKDANTFERENAELEHRQKKLADYINDIKKDKETLKDQLNKIKNNFNKIKDDQDDAINLFEKIGKNPSLSMDQNIFDFNSWNQNWDNINDDGIEIQRNFKDIIPQLAPITLPNNNGTYQEQEDAKSIFEKANLTATNAELEMKNKKDIWDKSKSDSAPESTIKDNERGYLVVKKNAENLRKISDEAKKEFDEKKSIYESDVKNFESLNMDINSQKSDAKKTCEVITSTLQKISKVIDEEKTLESEGKGSIKEQQQKLDNAKSLLDASTKEKDLKQVIYNKRIKKIIDIYTRGII